MEERLQKYLANNGIAARRKCEEYILYGKVKVNGKIVTTLGTKINPETDKVEFNGKEVKKIEKKVYVLLKKYESDIKESNNKLKRLYDGNMAYYQELEKYIVAGELALEEVEQYIYQIPLNNTISEEEKNMMVQKLEMCKEMLNQRIYDLRIAYKWNVQRVMEQNIL